MFDPWIPTQVITQSTTIAPTFSTLVTFTPLLTLWSPTVFLYPVRIFFSRFTATTGTFGLLHFHTVLQVLVCVQELALPFPQTTYFLHSLINICTGQRLLSGWQSLPQNCNLSLLSPIELQNSLTSLMLESVKFLASKSGVDVGNEISIQCCDSRDVVSCFAGVRESSEDFLYIWTS